jgi:membrane-associated phospholipid phosphatase
MIGWLHSIDIRVFRFINQSLSNSLFDSLMPFVSNSPSFACILLALAVYMIWKGGVRGRLCALMLLLSLCIGNWLVGDSIKNTVGRLRPFHTLPDAVLRVGMGGSYSFPSSHAANWFGATMILLIYFRRTVWILLPLAMLVGFSRVYNGVHYPSDVLAGAVLGAGYSAAVVWMLDSLWQFLGPRWFPLWKARLPSLIQPLVVAPAADADPKVRDAHWLRLGYLLTAFLLLLRLAYLASGKIELSEDEAYQWLWSKHPALSYYSKPLLIACAQFLGTHLWGDTEFGVRFFSPVISAVMAVLVLRFMAGAIGGRAAFVLILIMTATPLLALGSIVMTVDPLSVLFWTAAMITGWQAAGLSGTTRQWLWTGLWMGLGFLSKYTNLVQLVCWSVFFLLWPAARTHLRRPGPWLALLIVVFCSLPVVIWNSEHHWITAAHVASDGKLGEKWNRIYTQDFLLGEAGVLNPVFFIAALWAAVGFWRGGRHDPWQLFLFSMGTPLFLMYFVLSFHSRIEYNWIAPAVIPLFCLMAVYWRGRWQRNVKIALPFLSLGLGVGFFGVVMEHDTHLFGKLIHRELPGPADVLRRAHGWEEMARVVGRARQEIETQGTPTFILCQHYGFTSEISFYLPEAKRRVKTDPLVFYLATAKPDNQFYYWPNYLDHTGQNAIFVRELDRPHLRKDWLSHWLTGRGEIYANEVQPPQPLPEEIREQFDSTLDLGTRDILEGGEVLRRIQLIECLHLRRHD